MKRGLWSTIALLSILVPALAGAASPVVAPPPPAQSPDPGPKSLEITGVVPPAGERFDGRLTVVFNQPIRQNGSAAPLTFKPALEGKFTVGSNYISFLASGSPTVDVIEGRVAGGIVPAAAAVGRADRLRFALTSFEFKPASFWVIDQSTTATLFGLDFTAPVVHSAVRSRLKLLDNAGKTIPFTTFPGTSPSIVRLLVKGTPPPQITLKVAAAVPEAKGRFRTPQPAAFTLTLTRNQVVPPAVTSIDFSRVDGDGQTVRIHFNKPVKPESVRPRVTIDDISTTATRKLTGSLAGASDDWVDFRISAPDPTDVKVRVELKPGVEARDGLKTESARSQELAVRTQLRVDRVHWTSNEEKGLALELNFDFPLKLDEVKEHLSVVPALDAMEVVQTGQQEYTIRGDFAPDTPYRLALSPGVAYAGWATLKAPLPVVTNSPREIPKHIGYPETARYYFPRRFGNTVPARTRGYREVTASLCRMFPNNIAVGLGELNDTIRSDDDDFVDHWTEEVGRGRIDIQGSLSKLVTTPIALDRLTSAPLKGVYCLRLKGGESYWYNRVILMTDLGALAHWQAGEATFFVHNLYSLAPVASARVQVFSNKNQLLGEAETDRQGIARIGGFAAAKGEPKVAVIVAGDDSTYLELDSRDDGTQVFEQGSGSYASDAYDGFIYADRDLYRPGETAHLRWIVRQHYGDALAGAPLLLKIVSPTGKTMLDRAVPLSPLGTAGLDFPTLDTFPTGTYEATLHVPGGDEPLGRYSFRVEEFVPLRMKAELDPPAAPWVEQGKPFSLTVRARHLTGQPAQGRAAEARIVFAYGFDFKDWPQYRFGNDEPKPVPELELGRQATDETGAARFEFGAPQAAQATAPLRARVLGSVFELGGRAVRAAADAVYFPSPLCLGLKAEPGAGENEVAVSIAAVDPEGKPAALDKVHITLERETYNYYVQHYYTHLQPKWSNRFEQVEQRDVKLDRGVGTLSFRVTTYGFYRVRVNSPATRQYSTIGFYAWGGRPRIERDAQPSLIKLKLDRPEVTAGQPARLRIESAFDGEGVIAIQGEHIFKFVPVAIKGGSATVDLPTEPAYAPNVWIEVTVVHAVEKGRAQVYPFSSFAALPLTVRDPARRIDVGLPRLPAEVRPGAQVPVAIQLRDSRGRPAAAEVTLAAVDEGIHLITGYKTPDPAGWFARLRRPDFNRAHYYDKIAPDFDAPAPGGDGELGGERLGRPARTWIKTVALWSGRLTAGADGMASATLDIPEAFNGQLRLVAVAADAKACGAAEGKLFVRRPWMLQTSLPRFLLPGDRATALATVYNTTDATGTVRLSIATSGTLAMAEATSFTTFTVKPHLDVTRTFTLDAAKSIGQGEVIWQAEVADAGGKVVARLAEDQMLPVTEPAAWQSERKLTVLAPGKALVADTAGFLQDGWTRLSLTVGADPILRLNKALQDVVGYPYGCVEQTTSKLLPLYLVRKNSALVADLDPKLGDLDVYIKSGIDRLWAMQTASGGLAFWPGSNEPYPYGSVYALHFLTLVRNGREIPIDKNNYDILRRYVRRLVVDTRGNGYSDYYLRCYAIYVLSLAGEPDAPALVEWFRLLELPRSGRWLLAAALANSTRDTDRVRLYLESARTNPYLSREQYATLNSPARNEAVELLSLVAMKGSRAEMLKRADDLTHWLQVERWSTTQENAFVIAALCQYLDEVSSGVTGASAAIESGAGRTRIKGRELFRRTVKGPGAKFTVVNDGPVDLYVTSVAAGVPSTTQTTAVAQGIAIGRRLLDRKGATVDPANLVQGSSYVVELEIHCDREVRHMVVTDLLPAGFEVENPRLNQDERTGIVLPHGPVQPTHLELRDERVVLVFDQLYATPGRHKHYFYYVVNAVTPGRFQQPPVAAEAMYDPSVRGASAPGRIVVKGQE